MKRIFCLLVIALVTNFSFSQDGAEAEVDASEIHWISFEEAFELHQTAPKKWVIDISTEWCGWCKRMDKTTFSDSLVIDHVSQNFYAVALDGEFKDDITIGERTYEFVAEGRRGYHQLPAELMGGKMTYPTIIFLGDDLQNLSVIPGYKDAASFLQIVEFFEVYDVVENPITWNDFVADYVSPYPAIKEATEN